MQIARGGGLKNLLGQFGGALGGGCVELKDDDVELGASGGEGLEAGIGAEAAVEVERGGAALSEATGEFTAGDEGEKLVGGPESDRGSTGAGALQADFTEVQLL